MSRIASPTLLLTVLAVSTFLVAAEPTPRPRPQTAAKPGGWGIRQVLVANPKLPRVLLIGDSILNGYHAKAADLLRGKISLDVWVTPKHIGSKDLPADMKAIFAEHAYDVILFNDIGLHAWEPGRIPEGQYEPLLRAHLANLRKFVPRAKLIFASTTPMTTKTRPIALDPEFNSLIVERNKIAAKIMQENHVPFADYYGILATKLNLAAGDRFHWTKPAYELLAQCAATWIAEALGFSVSVTSPAAPASFHQAKGAAPPGVVIDRSPDPSRVYIGSPSIAVLPSGEYLASHDFFGPGTTNSQTAVFASKDRGATWRKVATLDGQWWSTLFVHRNALYILGTSKEYGAVVIRRSTDAGRTWTNPQDRHSGLLLDDGKYHCAPVPVVIHKGRIWRAVEYFTGQWGTGFCPLVISAPIDADLLRADAWTASNRLEWGSWQPYVGWLEGNVVVTPKDELVDILRVQKPGAGKAARVQIGDDGKTIRFDPARDFIDFPGGSHKFTIRYDEQSRRYWSLVNKDYDPPAVRNVLALVSSPDLEHWTVKSILLRHSDSRHHAWQYLDWLFDGNDLIAVSRTAWDGSHSFHDANYLTFHRIANFRRLTIQDSRAAPR